MTNGPETQIMSTKETIKDLYSLEVLKKHDVVTSKKIPPLSAIVKAVKGNSVIVFKGKVGDTRPNLKDLKEVGLTSLSYKEKKDQLIFISKDENRIGEISSNLIDMMMLHDPEDDSQKEQLAVF